MTQNAVVQPGRSGGRPRSEKTRQVILLAALELAKTEAIASVTIEAIARTAGVSKATIYRWWDSKASIIIDAFVEHYVIQTPMPRDRHPAEALVQHWRSLVTQYSGWAGKIVAQILAEGQSDPAVLREFRERFHYGRRAVVREVLQQLIGECPSLRSTPAEYLMDMFYGPVYMRLIWGHAPLDDDFVLTFPLQFFRALGVNLDENGRLVSDNA